MDGMAAKTWSLQAMISLGRGSHTANSAGALGKAGA